MSFTHLLLILVIVLLFFGPSRLPGLGKGFGDAVKGFKKAMKDDDAIDVTETSKRSERLRGSEDSGDGARDVSGDATRATGSASESASGAEKDKTRS